jgi:anti-sigma B factor antagonist
MPRHELFSAAVTAASLRRRAFSFAEESLGRSGFVLVVSGEIDLAASPELRSRLNAAIDDGARAVIVDLSDVTFMDSLALAAVVRAKERLGPGGRLAVVSSHPYVRLVIEAGGLDSVLDIFETRDEAAAHVKR